MKNLLYLLILIPLCVYSNTEKDSVSVTRIVNIEQRLSDIENTTKELSILLNEKELSTFSNVIIEYFKGLSQSKYKDYPRVYEIFFENINNREKLFAFFTTIPSAKEIRIAKIMYGNILKSKFPDIELDEKEKKTLYELKKLKDEEFAEIKSEINKQEQEIAKLNEQLATPNIQENRTNQLKQQIADFNKEIDTLNKKIDRLNLQ
jgi:hypothetical protein